MGRYYSGDIEGKFWVALQPSDDADFFGVEGAPPSVELEYSYEQEDLELVKERIKECEKELGEFKAKINQFFKKNNGYNDEMLIKYLKVDREKVRRLLKWYARLQLGQKIGKCLEEKGYCYFTAEC